ncbi:MAG: DUF5104 domain-containing protein [Oscillospiraceae bacterium]
MRRILVLLLSMSIVLTSCSFPFSSKENTPGRVELAEQTQNEIMDCFLNKDSEGIINLMSPYVQQNYALDTEIEEAFEYIDGEIVSYDEPKFGASAAASDESGWVRYGYHGSTENVITDKGTEYTISFKGWCIYRDDASKVGVYRIYISNETKKETIHGTIRNFEEYSISIGEKIQRG